MNTQLVSHPARPSSRSRELQGRFAVVTGGTRGIGRAIAERLAARGASVLVAARGESAAGFEHRPLDLASLDSVAAFAQALERDGRPIDLLVLAAGVHLPWKTLHTGDGHELHWQVNYLSNFLLSQRLLPLCTRSGLARVVYLASEAHRLAPFTRLPPLGFWRHYARSKEAAVTYFLRLQQLHPELCLRVVSPGYVDSAIHDHKGAVERRIERIWSRPRTPRSAAARVLGTFDRRPAAHLYWDRGSPTAPSARCAEPERADALWEASHRAVRRYLAGARPPERISNYARNVEALVPAIERPRTLEELAGVLRTARERGRPVKVVGRRHSYNDSFHSSGTLISLERFDRILAFDPELRTVTCEAGMSVGVLCQYLDQRGFALRYSGNFGEQSLAGALATGTHGYGREGGVMSELVRAATVMRADGSLVSTSEERDLRSLRLSVGALGAIVSLTLAIEPVSPCHYQVGCMRRAEFTEALSELARAHEYLRFVRHPFDTRQVLYVTIDRLASDADTTDARYIADGEPRGAGMLVPLLRMPPVRKVVGRLLSVRKKGFALRVPFSALLFIRSGVVERHAGLAKVGAMALDRPDWLNMELAVPIERYGEFERLFADEMPDISRISRRRPYFTSRVVGGGDNVVLAPNHGRDVVFCDVHADPTQPSSRAFLERLERTARTELRARPHWGKVFYAESGEIAALYPAENLAEFASAKRRFDPDGAFSNPYTRRVLGL